MLGPMTRFVKMAVDCHTTRAGSSPETEQEEGGEISVLEGFHENHEGAETVSEGTKGYLCVRSDSYITECLIWRQCMPS